MNRIIVFISFMFFTNNIFAQLNDVRKIFDRYQDVEGVTSIRVGKPMFNMLTKLNIQDDDLKKIQPMLSKINSINILITGSGKLLDSLTNIKPGLFRPGNTPPGLQNEINQAVQKLNYQELVTVNAGGRKIKLLTVESSGDVVHNLLLSITGNDQNILMLLDGDVPLNDVSKFISGDK